METTIKENAADRVPGVRTGLQGDRQMSQVCPRCYNSPSIVCCALCYGYGIVSRVVHDAYQQLKEPTVAHVIAIRGQSLEEEQP